MASFDVSKRIDWLVGVPLKEQEVLKVFADRIREKKGLSVEESRTAAREFWDLRFLKRHQELFPETWREVAWEGKYWAEDGLWLKE